MGGDTIIEFSFSKEPVNFDISDVIVIDGELSTFLHQEGSPTIYSSKFTPKTQSEGNRTIISGAVFI